MTSSFARLRAGRIVEVFVRRLANLEDVESLHVEVSGLIRSAGTEVVICSDCRFVSPLSREVAHAWSRSMRLNNRGIARSGIALDPANTMFNLQFERVVRCAIKPERRAFEDLRQLREWVGGPLSESERAALRELLGGVAA